MVITSRGDGRRVPEKRTLHIRFQDIGQCKFTLFVDGMKAEAAREMCRVPAAVLAFEAGREYCLEVEYPLPDVRETRLARALRELTYSEGGNDEKARLRAELQKAQSKEEYLAAVDASGLSEGVKPRLKESL